MNRAPSGYRVSGFLIDTYKQDAQASVSDARTGHTRLRVVMLRALRRTGAKRLALVGSLLFSLAPSSGPTASA